MENFAQTKRVGTSGNFINQIMGNNSTRPEIGKGATILHYSDRDAYEVIEVSKDGKSCIIEALDPIYEGLMNEYAKDYKPTGRFSKLVWRNKAWRLESQKVVFTNEFIKQFDSSKYFNFAKYLKEHNLEAYNIIYANGTEIIPCAIVEKITRIKKNFSKVSVVFGTKQYYRDPSF